MLAAVDKGSFIDMLKGSSVKTASQDKVIPQLCFACIRVENVMLNKLIEPIYANQDTIGKGISRGTEWR